MALPPGAGAQQPCAPPALSATSKEINIFNAEQEINLGDIIAQQIIRSLRTSTDPEMISYLNRISGRLIKNLPDTHLDLRFSLVDFPTANSFAIAGGRIYVSPKLILTAKSEDELAAVLAHEIGHLVTHQTAIQVTRELHDALGITAVGDRQDILRKYNLLIDNWRRKPGAFRAELRQSQQHQLDADQVALYMLASAGYSLEAMAAIFERTSGASDKGGGWLSDLFGRTAPEVRRLREMARDSKSLPPNCIDHVAAGSSDEFLKWQRIVQEYSGWDHQRALHNVLTEVHLNPPLQPALWKLRFSPDGKYVLAQDAASIYVLTVQPLSPIMQIEAPGGGHVQFTPDSKAIVFENGNMRVEQWEIASQKRTAVHELARPEVCRSTLLSPDGSVLACFVKSGQLMLLDVATGNKIFETKELNSEFLPNYITMPFTYETISAGRQHSGFVHMAFSPDARYFVAAAGDKSVAVELASRQTVPLAAAIRKNLSGDFTFLAGDRIILTPEFKNSRAYLFKFSTGEKLGEFPLGRGSLTASQDGSFVALRPIRDFAVGVWDLRTHKGILGNKNSALDIFGDHFVQEQNDGEVGYYKISGDGTKRDLISYANLPSGRLGGVRTLSVSDDLRWLALSDEHRGAVWDLTRGSRLYILRSFHGAYFGPAKNLLIDFPKFEKTERTLAQASLDQEHITPATPITDEFARLGGKHLLSLRSPKGEDFEITGPDGRTLVRGTDAIHGWTLTVSEPLTGTQLWSRSFSSEGPRILGPPVDENIILMWRAGAKQVNEEQAQFPEVRARLSSTTPGKDDELLEVVNLQTGKLLGTLLLDTGKGSFSSVQAMDDGDRVTITDTENRTLVYSLATGAEIGKCFGVGIAINKARGLLATRNGRGQLDLYNLDSMERVDSYVFPAVIVHAQFSKDGSRLLVLTSEQTAYTLSLDEAQPMGQN